jgi:hypothetical protein
MTAHRHVNLAAVDLYGEIEQLIRREPQHAEATAAPGSGVASKRDAVEAVAQLAVTFEKPAYAGDLDPAVANRIASLLLVIRDYLEPMSSTRDERVSRYLAEVTRGLRRL